MWSSQQGRAHAGRLAKRGLPSSVSSATAADPRRENEDPTKPKRLASGSARAGLRRPEFASHAFATYPQLPPMFPPAKDQACKRWMKMVIPGASAQ